MQSACAPVSAPVRERSLSRTNCYSLVELAGADRSAIRHVRSAVRGRSRADWAEMLPRLAASRRIWKGQRAMDDERLVPVSPRHSVLLSREYLTFIDTPPQRDYVVRTVAKRQVGAMMLMSGDLVIASAETRATLSAGSRVSAAFSQIVLSGPDARRHERRIRQSRPRRGADRHPSAHRPHAEYLSQLFAAGPSVLAPVSVRRRAANRQHRARRKATARLGRGAVEAVRRGARPSTWRCRLAGSLTATPNCTTSSFARRRSSC